jgi:nitrate ABC transporter ATP-binding subunit
MTTEPQNSTSFLDISMLNKTYDSKRGPAVIVDRFDLAIKEGEFVCLLGHSGCGKSTVLSCVAGLTRQTKGKIVLSDKEVTGPGTDRGVVFQSPCLLPWLTALDNVLMAVDQARPQDTAKYRTAFAMHCLDLVGLGDSMHRRAAELSSGMQQRVGIARAFALTPKVLLLDEPFGMLDSLTRIDLQEVLITLWREHRTTALMVTHDVDEALFLSDRIAIMTSGPAATLGKVVPVHFAHPRDRQAVLSHPDYDRLRDELIDFLEHQAHPKAA